MVGPMIVIAASAGLGALVGMATAPNRSSAGGLPLAGAGGAPQGPSCTTCCGTGKVACLCARWSDGDVGCRTCAGSGRTACRSCRGTGTGRRAGVRVAVRAQRPLVAVTKSK